MSDAAYQKYIDGIDEALASIEINPKQVRQDIALQLIGGDAIHPTLYTIVPRAQLQRIGQVDNRFDFIIDIIDNHVKAINPGELQQKLNLTDFHDIDEVAGIGNFNTTRFVDMMDDVINFANDILVDYEVPRLQEFNELPVYLKQFILHTAEFIGEATEMGTLPTTNELDVIPDLIAEYGVQDTELHPDFLTDIEDVYNRTDGVNYAPGFFNKYNRIGADAADIFQLSVNDTLRIPIEQTRGFMVESLNNRLILQLHSALQDPVHGGYIQNLLDEVEYEYMDDVNSFFKPDPNRPSYGSFSDKVDYFSDNAWYGIKNTTNRYVSLFREKLSQFVNGNVTGLYVPDDEVIMIDKISRSVELALRDFAETLQGISQGNKYGDTKDLTNLIQALGNETGYRLLNGFQEGGGLLGLGDLHKFFTSPGAPLQVIDGSNFVLSDDAVKATGALNPEFIDTMLEVRKMTPGLVPEIQQTVQEMTNMLKPTIDNAYSVFEIKPPPNDVFHIRPLKDFLNYANANQNVDVKFYNFNTSKFEDMGILGIVKSGVNNSNPDTLVIQVTPKEADKIEDVVKFVSNLPQEAGTAPTINKMIAETPQDIVEYVDKSKLPEVEKVLKNPKIGPAIASTAVDFAKKAGKFAFGGVMAGFAPGDIAIETAIRKLLPRLGLVAISGPALAAYTAYELGLLAADAGAAFAKKEQGEKFWDNFGEISDKYSIGYKLTKEIHNTLFDEVYGKMNQNVYAGADS